MSSINAALGSAGAGIKFTVGDETYTLMPLTKGIQAEFESWLESAARASILRGAGDVKQAVISEALMTLGARSAAGEFAFGGPLSAQSLQTPGGFVKLVGLMLAPKHPDLSTDDVDSLFESHQECVVAAFNAATASVRQGNAKPARTPEKD